MVVPPPPLRATSTINNRTITAAIAPIAIHTGLRYQRPPPRFTLMSTVTSFVGVWSSPDAAAADIVVPADRDADADAGRGAASATPAMSTSDSSTPRMNTPPELHL